MGSYFKQTFHCTTLSDIALPAQLATALNLQALDFLPGSVFWGIAAKHLYDESKAEQTLDLFHRGRVRFSDARPIVTGAIADKIPLDWHSPKSGKNIDVFNQKEQEQVDAEKKAETIPVYCKNQLLEADWNLLDAKDILLEPRKSGYMIFKAEDIEAKQEAFYQQVLPEVVAYPKSARDPKTGLAADSQLYIYKAIRKDQVFGFTISSSNEEYVKVVADVLSGIQYIGKSKSAEFGKVDIKATSKVTPIEEVASPTKEEKARLVVYAASRWCLLNEYGQYTLELDPIRHLKLSSGKINWEASTVRSGRYAPWNGKRRAQNPERHFIQAGSVFVVEGAKHVNPSLDLEGIGVHRAEGFGELLINPPFLQAKTLRISQKRTKVDGPKLVEETPLDANNKRLLQALSEQKQSDDARIKQLAWDFREQYKDLYRGIKPNQWSVLRKFHPESSAEAQLQALSTGLSQLNWAESNRLPRLTTYVGTRMNTEKQRIYFLHYLSAIMSK